VTSMRARIVPRLAALAAVALSSAAFAAPETASAPKPTPPLVVTPPSPKPASVVPSVQTGPGGKAEMPETTFDAGEVERGAEVKHAFVIKNVGEHPLTVEAKPG